jgi:sulfane dehydrogenase subunit SoxC
MIHGLVERPLQFDLEALDRYPMVSNVNFLECAGNSGRNAFDSGPYQITIDQLHGLVSNAEWTGVPLNILLD